ncbi:unnamed protein product [Urochloa humidicola]
MAASGSGGAWTGGRPWTATSTWAPGPGGGAVDDAISFETSDEDAETTPAGVVLSRQPPDGDGDAPPCEVTVSFRGKYEIHWVYVRSTARIYELYHSTDTKGTSKDYLCTVRCGLADKEPQPCGEESMSQCSGGAPTSDKREQETKSVSSSSDEDSWVDVKIPESLMGNSTPDAQERNAVRICQENTLAHYEATAEMTDVSPCVSLTVRLLSLKSKESVHIEEICIFADPVESTNDNSVTCPGNMGGSSLLTMLVPGLMQMSKSSTLNIDDRYFSDGSRTQLTQDRAVKESIPSAKVMQETGLNSTDNYKPSGIESGIKFADSGTVSSDKNNQAEFQLKDPNSLPLPVQTKKSTQGKSVKDQQASDTDHLANPLANEKITPYYNHNIERKLDTLLCKVEKMELYCSRFEDSMIKPLGSIEARLQRLEEQFSSFSVEIQSLRCSSAVRSAQDSMSNTTNSQDEVRDYANDRTVPLTDRKPGLAVRAPDFSSDDFCCYSVSSGNQVNFRGPNVVPRLLVKVPDFSGQPELTGGNIHDGPSSPVYCAPSSEKERKISPGLVVKVPEFPDDDDDDEVEEEKEVVEEKEVEVGDGNAQYDDTLNKSIVDSTKCKKSVSINGALASALEALLTSTKGTSSSKPAVSIASNLSAENTNGSLSCSLSPERVAEMSTKDCPSGDASLVGAFISSQEIDATPHTSLSGEILVSKVEIDEQNDDLNVEKVSFVASTESSNAASQPDTVEQSIDNGSLEPLKPPTVFEAADNGVQVNENRPAMSLVEFLAARNASSGKNVTPEVCSGGGGAKNLPFEKTLSGADKDSKHISQLLVKKALEVDADEGEHFSSVSIGPNFYGSSSVPPGNAASGHNISTEEAVSGKSCGLKNAESGFRLSVGMDSTFSQYHATDSKKEWIENSSSIWSPDDSLSKPNVMHSWSNLSSMELFSEVSAKEPVVSVNATSANYVEDLEDIEDCPITTQISGEELQKVCDLLYEFKDDMLGMTSTVKGTSKSSLSLEVLLAESSDSEAQISDLEDIDNGAGIGSARLFSTFSSSDDDATTGEEPLVDVADLTTPSEPYASAVNDRLLDVADLTKPSGTDASVVNEPSADVVDLPDHSDTCASDLNDEPLVSVDGLPKPLETFSGESSGEHLDSLI